MLALCQIGHFLHISHTLDYSVLKIPFVNSLFVLNHVFLFLIGWSLGCWQIMSWENMMGVFHYFFWNFWDQTINWENKQINQYRKWSVFAALVLMPKHVREWWSFLLVKALDTLDEKINVAFSLLFFCCSEHSALANWLLLYAVQAWLLVQHSPLYFGSLFISNYFQHFLRRAANSAQGRLEARTASLSLQQTGLAATWRVTSKTQHPTDCQRVPWQRRDPRPCYLKGLNVRTAGLHSACSTSNCTADGITRYYIPAGWIIHAIKTLSSQLNEQ